jgi:hypothetical protein
METQTPPSPPTSTANPPTGKAARSPLPRQTAAPQAASPTEPAEDGQPTFRERLSDALRYLCTGRTPTVAIGGTLVFPVVLALGAMLTAISDVFVARLIAVVPALFLLAMVGLACQHTLRCTLRGLDEADDLPPPAEFARQSLRLLPHVAVLGAVFLGPGAVMLRLDQWQFAFLLLPAGLFLLPMAGAQLLGTGDWRSLSPALLFSAIRRGGRPYLDTAAAVALLAVPAVLAFALTLGLPGYTLVSIVGPLGVVPSLMAARMMGLLLEQERARFEGLFAAGNAREAQPESPPPAAASRPAQPKPSQPKPAQAKPAQSKPAQTKPVHTPLAQSKPAQSQSTQAKPTAQPAKARPAPTSAAPATKAAPASKPAPAPAAKPAPAARPAPKQ